MSKLIMIDDSPMEHFIMEKMFERYELFNDVAYTQDAQSVIDFLDDNKHNTSTLPDLIFVDLHMPVCDGFSFLEQFEKLRACFKKQICVYVISSSLENNDRRRVAEYPFVKKFLTKPVTEDELSAIYATYFKRVRLAS